jgi:hypothetical protein
MSNQGDSIMASINDVDLSIEADAVGNDPQAVLTVTYTAEFDEYDQTSNQLYQESWRVFGADRGAGEDGIDDTIQRNPVAVPVRFSSGGQASVDREIVIELDLDELDEDNDAQNPDEIRVSVNLVPVGPFDDSQESNRVLLTL